MRLPIIKWMLLAALAAFPLGMLHAEEVAPSRVSFGVIGMAGGAVEALEAFQDELNVRITHLKPGRFEDQPPDLSDFDAVLTSFASSHLKAQYKQAVLAALKKKPGLKIFCVGPKPICDAWAEWVGHKNMNIDAEMAAYYGLSKASMKEMLRYALITYFGREGKLVPPGQDELVRVFHPKYGELKTIEAFLARAEKDGWDIENSPRVALGSWRHHVLFHQPKVIDALIEELEKQGLLAVDLVADDAGFRERLTEYKPDLVIMTSHTREPPDFWQKLGVPRIHTLWFTNESIDTWRRSNQPGMTKSSMFHQIVSSELKGATECLTAGGTEAGGDSGEEILPIPDRIRRIAARTKAWIGLAKKANAEKKIAIIGYDREADKAGLLSGPAHNLNAPRSLIKLLKAMITAGYELKNPPTDTEDLLARLVDHGRQMGSWEPGTLDKLAGSGKAVLVQEDKYRLWFEETIPQWRREEVIKQWGPVPGDIMVWMHEGKRYLVLPKIDMGNVLLMTQPPKGETITASMNVQDPDESLLPPTHHYLATYFWLQRDFKADALVHFGSHGSEWLYPGKQAMLSRSDWSDMLIGDIPNINPWLSSNTSEILPCKRRARAVTVDFMPPPLMEAGLSDELLNLESTINKYDALETSALKKKFASSIAEQVKACKLDRDLALSPETDGAFNDGDIQRISKHLHDLGNELIPASMHVLGEPPADDLRIPYLVHCMGKRFIESAEALFPDNTNNYDQFIKVKGQEMLRLILDQKLSPEEAVKAAGGVLPGGVLPEAIKESLNIAIEMNANLEKTPQEIASILAALDGKYVMPGPSGNPERNPSVLPTGRNMYVLNPEELPSRSSWELGSKLIEEYLAEQKRAKGLYPKKIAFSLVPFATYSDFGIVESQIMRLIGVRPVWDAKNRVRDVELIPAAELGRPRIDVFLSARSIYRDELPSMMRLLDKAIRLAASLKEPENDVYRNSETIRKELESKGIPKDKALALSRARMYGAKPEEIIDSHNWFFYLTERSGEWETREDLLDVYLDESKYVYADGVWGEKSPIAFDSAIRDTDLILRSWYDNRDFVLSNKFTWWVDGTLSLAIKHVTGKEPDYLFVDVRDPEEASLVDSNKAVQRDFRVRLTNPKWIEGMMKEGYAGGNNMAKNIDNLMGWEIMRENSVADSNWSDLADVYVRDKQNLGLREWFDKTNPHAFQKVAVTLMETMRKGFWDVDDKTRLEVTEAYARSVAEHGRSGGVREGGNEKLETFVADTLSAPNSPEMNALLEAYQKRSAEQQAPADPSDPTMEPVQGNRLEKKQDEQNKTLIANRHIMLFAVVGVAFLIVLAGFVGRGARTRKDKENRS